MSLPYDPASFSFPLREGGGPKSKFGELAMPADEVKDAKRLVLLGGLVGYVPIVGVPGRELLLRGGGEPVFGGASPEAASVRRNSTQRREND